MTQGSLERAPIDVVVIGRANVDLTLRVPFRPAAGQTVLASALTAPGGKSFNQAMTIARLGGHVALVAQVGDDAWGHQIETALFEAGVDTSALGMLNGVSTGMAIIEVSPDGANSIILAISGATELTRADIDMAMQRFNSPVVVQLDLPADALSAVLALPPHRLVLGNLAPTEAPDSRVLERLDVIVVNEDEAAKILNRPNLDPIVAAERLRRLGPSAAVVTAGRHGAAYSTPDASDLIPAPAVPVVDTTGAGDAFLGSLALDISRGMPTARAVTRAVQVGAHAVQYHGASANAQA